MIVRTWRGWTTPSNADQYERVLMEHVIPSIAERGIPGVAGPAVLRREVALRMSEIDPVSFEIPFDVLAGEAESLTRLIG